MPKSIERVSLAQVPVERWQEQSRLCSRDQTIKSVAIKALTCLAACVAGAMAATATPIGIAAGMTVLLLGIIFNKISNKRTDWTDYQDPTVVARLVQTLRTANLQDTTSGYVNYQTCAELLKNGETLERYGIIPNAKEMRETLESFREVQEEDHVLVKSRFHHGKMRWEITRPENESWKEGYARSSKRTQIINKWNECLRKLPNPSNRIMYCQVL